MYGPYGWISPFTHAKMLIWKAAARLFRKRGSLINSEAKLKMEETVKKPQRLFTPQQKYDTVSRLLRTPLARALACAVLGMCLAYFTNAFHLDSRIANSWPDYHYGPQDKRMVQINLPEKYGAAMLFLSNKDGSLVGLEDHTRNWHFDDIGYMLFAQLAVLWRGEITPDQLAWWHNALFIFSGVALAAAIAYVRQSVVLAILVMGQVLLIRAALEPHIYSSVSQHTLITVLPLSFLATLVLFSFLLSTASVWLAVGISVLAGGIVGAIDLVRHSLGLACVVTLVGTLCLSRCSMRRLTASASAALLGFLMITVVVPATAAIHRDRVLGWYQGLSSDYFKRSPIHRPYFSLLAGIGRYPNSLGLRYNDHEIDMYLVSLHRTSNYAADFDTLAKEEYLAFIRQHPREYAGYLLRGFAELPLVVPAVTFNHEFLWGGTPIIPPDAERTVDDYDRQPSNPNRLHNIHLRYLRLTMLQWLAYGCAAVLLIGVTIYCAWDSWIRGVQAYATFWGGLILLAMLAIPRSMIPVHGQDFVVTFWLLAVLAFAEAWAAIGLPQRQNQEARTAKPPRTPGRKRKRG